MFKSPRAGNHHMSNPNPLHVEVERQLTKLACDAIVDPAREAIDAALAALVKTLEDGGAQPCAAQMRDAAASTDAASIPGVLQTLWQRWCDDEDVRRDVEALSADAELSGMFVAEALDHLGTIEATLLRLEEAPGDRALINDVFRPFHTIKGNAGALGVTTVQELAHKVENLLDRCRSGQHAVGSPEVDVVLKAVDLLTAMMNDLSARASGHPGQTLKAQRIALVATVERIIEGGGAAVPEATPAPVSADMAAALFDMPEPKAPAPSAAAAAANRESQNAVKVETRKLDGLVDMVGELVILQSLVYEDPAIAAINDERLTRTLAQLRRLTTDLQRGAMAMRMVPIRQTFQKMSRLVRDLSKKSGKPIELVLAGEDTELDRKVVEDINDPLMHMVRNSLDHGIEPPDRRAASGKRDTGRLSLRAFHQGGNIVIEVADDGAGLPTEKILKKAIAQGLVPADKTLAPADIHQLIFAPGFSTADKITEISGRGVGMDVVKRNIEALRGRIDIRTEQGQGTTFAIKLPLTLAILDGLLVKAGGERFVVPTFAIRESLRPAASQIHTLQGQPRLIQVREELMPLVWLTDLFNQGCARMSPTDGTVVVIEEEGRRIGVVVDALVGKQEVVVKSLGESFAGVLGVAGGAILGDGRIGLILDAHGLVRLMHDEKKAA
jgi:two-component system chemotaxis sensor kinase CheA